MAIHFAASALMVIFMHMYTIQKKSNDQIYKIDEIEVEDYEGGSKNPEKKEKLEKINGFRA